jgi:acetylornithine deacetylase/succinyl-diaminopimelate desuccinylase-like protein
MHSPHLDDLFAFLRFPSVSTEPRHAGDVAACGQWLVEKLTAIGLTAELHPTKGHPIVTARNQHQPGRRTVMIYGHYDVQPVEPLAEWTTPPFEPVIRDGIIYGRGSTDNKGQILAHVLGVGETLREKGELPVNLIFLIEGEEEVGSQHLADFLTANREALRCDIIAISDTGMIAPRTPTFTYGLRGISAMEVRIHGPAIDLHSGIYGGMVANPATAIARLIATLHDAQGRVAVAGFYDEVAPLEQWERDAWARLPFGEKEVLGVTGSAETFGEEGYTSLERAWARPTAEVNGIGGGFQGTGSKTVIPREAFAKLTFRLVPAQRPSDILWKITNHLIQHCPPGVRLQFDSGHSGDPYLTDPHSAYGKAAQRALATAFPGQPLALIREGGSIPIVNTFRKILGVETLLLGLALPDCRAHAPDENFPVENFEAGIRLNRALLAELALEP